MATTRVFTVPDLGEGLTDATLTGWYVTEGDQIELNQPLCSVVTAKAEVDIPSPWAGRVHRLHGAEGETVDVGSPLVEVETSPGTSGGDPPPGAGPGGDGPVLVGYGTSASRPRRSREVRMSPQGAPGGTTSAAEAAPSAAPRAATRAKPPVRALAKRLGVDLSLLAPGSGPDGIVTRADVESAGRALRSAPDPVVPPAEPPVAERGTDATRTGVRVVPVRGIRATIAERMTQSRRTIPEAWCGRWVDATDLVAHTERLRATAEPALAPALTPFALVLRYTVAALRLHPELNATFDAEAGEIRMFEAVHLGVAVADERGLIVPVVRHAEQLTTAQLALEVRRLIQAVRSGSASPPELQGSTFTVSNFGSLGLDDGNPVINAPEAAILGVGAIRPRPAVFDGELAVRSTTKLTCAFDHRIGDGADAGGFLADLARMVEHPDRALLDL